MKKDKCFYCGEKLPKEIVHSVVIDFKHINCCGQACLDELTNFFDFVKAGKKWWLSGLIIGGGLMFISAFLFIVNITFGTIATAAGWGIVGITVYFFPAITPQAHFIMSLKKTRKMAKVVGLGMMLTAPLWLLLLFIPSYDIDATNIASKPTEPLRGIVDISATFHHESKPTHGFAAILDAYAEFEQSDFLNFDRELISPSYFVLLNHYTSHYTSRHLRNNIMYALHDINGDGVYELFMGALWWYGQVRPSIFAVYALQDNLPVSVVYEWSNNVALNLVVDVYENYFIHAFGGRMGIGWDTVHGFDQNGNFVELEGVYAWQRNTLCHCCYEHIIEFTEFYRHTEGHRHLGEDLLISEDEYNAFFAQWGIHNSERYVTLGWQFLIP